MAFIKNESEKPHIKLTESVVQNLLSAYEAHTKRYPVMVPCCMNHSDNEADLFAIRKSGFCDEFEIKLSRTDFLRDRQKVVMYRRNDITTGEDNRWFTSKPQDRSRLAPWEKFKLDALRDGNMNTNFFWYVLKKDIIPNSEVPDFAGIIIIEPTGAIRVERQPTKLHNRKLSPEHMFKFASFLNERFWKYRTKITNGA